MAKSRAGKQLRSAGAAVARTVARMPKPKKVAVLLNEDGGSQTLAVSKPLRGGEHVLSVHVNQFEVLANLDDDAAATNLAAAAPAADLADAAALPFANADLAEA